MTRSIHKDTVIPLLLAACPSFSPTWRAYLESPSCEPGLLYIDLGELARHLVGMVAAGRAAELEPVFHLIEELHLHGDAFVREAATIGLLEGIQNDALARGVDAEAFESLLLDETKRWWRKLQRFWEGDASALRTDSE